MSVKLPNILNLNDLPMAFIFNFYLSFPFLYYLQWGLISFPELCAGSCPPLAPILALKSEET